MANRSVTSIDLITTSNWFNTTTSVIPLEQRIIESTESTGATSSSTAYNDRIDESAFQQAAIQNDNTINNDGASPSMKGGNEIQNMVAGKMNDVLRHSTSSSQAQIVQVL